MKRKVFDYRFLFSRYRLPSEVIERYLREKEKYNWTLFNSFKTLSEKQIDFIIDNRDWFPKGFMKAFFRDSPLNKKHVEDNISYYLDEMEINRNMTIEANDFMMSINSNFAMVPCKKSYHTSLKLINDKEMIKFLNISHFPIDLLVRYLGNVKMEDTNPGDIFSNENLTDPMFKILFNSYPQEFKEIAFIYYSDRLREVDYYIGKVDICCIARANHLTLETCAKIFQIYNNDELYDFRLMLLKYGNEKIVDYCLKKLSNKLDDEQKIELASNRELRLNIYERLLKNLSYIDRYITSLDIIIHIYKTRGILLGNVYELDLKYEEILLLESL